MGVGKVHQVLRICQYLRLLPLLETVLARFAISVQISFAPEPLMSAGTTAICIIWWAFKDDGITGTRASKWALPKQNVGEGKDLQSTLMPLPSRHGQRQMARAGKSGRRSIEFLHFPIFPAWKCCVRTKHFFFLKRIDKASGKCTNEWWQDEKPHVRHSQQISIFY